MPDFYFQPWTQIQRQYYEFHTRQGRGAKLLNLEPTDATHYRVRFELLRDLHRRLQPYRFLRDGDRVIMAGVSDGFIELGVSTLFITSSVVGPSGHVYAVEPDERNVAAIRRYIEANEIANVTVIPRALWKRDETLEFVKFRDFTSSNMFRDQFERKEADQKVLWGEARRQRESYTEQVPAVCIDSLARSGQIEDVRFLNVTINGAEADALEGASTFLARPD
ncbi:FkbM family methyltransferase, partial [bacterium]|nr:FkbM family methyltransferase [bacterium]